VPQHWGSCKPSLADAIPAIRNRDKKHLCLPSAAKQNTTKYIVNLSKIQCVNPFFLMLLKFTAICKLPAGREFFNQLNLLYGLCFCLQQDNKNFSLSVAQLRNKWERKSRTQSANPSSGGKIAIKWCTCRHVCTPKF